MHGPTQLIRVFAGLAFLFAATNTALAEEDLRVVVSIKPLYGITASVMEGAGTPELLIDGAVSPHTFQFRPSQMQQLNDADLLVWMGEYIEMPLAGSIEGLPTSTRVLAFAEHPALIQLPYRSGGVWSRDIRDDHDDHDDHGGHDEDADHHDHAGGVDPHLWLDPRNGILMARLIAERLGELDPANAHIYMANAEALSARLSALDAEIESQLDGLEGVPFIVFHDAFQYFEARYGLSGAGSIAIDAERTPGPRTIMALRNEIRDREIPCVFSEPQFSTQLVDTVVEGSGALTAVLDPLGAQWPAGPGVYEHLLEGLAQGFAACLGDAE